MQIMAANKAQPEQAGLEQYDGGDDDWGASSAAVDELPGRRIGRGVVR
jgi:hypothetical protein